MSDVAHRSKFFLCLSYVMLAIVLIGFSPTFYLRAIFDVPAIPLYVYVHGAAMTSWYIWFCVQTTAVNSSRVALHRRLGVIGITIAVLVLISGVAVALGLAPRLLEKYGDIESDFARIVGIVWGNLGTLVAFACLLTLLVMLGIFDRINIGRVHQVTLIGGLALFAGLIFFGLVVPLTSFGHSFILALV